MKPDRLINIQTNIELCLYAETEVECLEYLFKAINEIDDALSEKKLIFNPAPIRHLLIITLKQINALILLFRLKSLL
jgi:hypothetical protein